MSCTATAMSAGRCGPTTASSPARSTRCEAVAFVAVDLGLPLADALRKAISPPSRFGLDHQIGRFVPGARANLVHLTGSLTIARAWVGGCDARELAGAQ
jgi:N-acetylglucosamine-6-phosphate deacetylase